MARVPSFIVYLEKECKRLNKMLQHVDMPPEHHDYEELIFMRQYDIRHFACNEDPNIRALWFQREMRRTNLDIIRAKTRRNILDFLMEEDFVTI